MAMRMLNLLPLVALTLLSGVAAEQLTCRGVKAFYQEHKCCNNPSKILPSASCPEVPEMHKKCLEIRNINHASGCNAHQVQVVVNGTTKEGKKLGTYCLVSGDIGEGVPFEFILPLDTGVYKDRLLGRGGYAIDNGYGTLGGYEYELMADYGAIVAHMASNGENPETGLPPQDKGSDEIPTSESMKVENIKSYFGSSWALYKRYLNAIAVHMYADKLGTESAPYTRPTRSYMSHGACSGAARNAITNAIMDPEEWSGITAKDYFEISPFQLRTYYWLPLYKGWLDLDVYKRVWETMVAWCDAKDGIPDGNLQHNCMTGSDKYLPSYYACTNTDTSGVPDANVTCFNSTEMEYLTPMFGPLSFDMFTENPKSLEISSDESDLWGMPPMLWKNIMKGLGEKGWSGMAGNWMMAMMPDYLGELKEKFMDVAVEEYSKPKAVRDRFRAYVEQLMDSPGNFDRAIKYIRMIEPMTNMANRFVQNNYISKFKKAGGKIILHSAMGDTYGTSTSGMVWWHRIWKYFEKQRSQVDEFVQMYQYPSSRHCGAYPGEQALNEDMVSNLAKLMAWVEDGTAPTYTVYPTNRPACQFPFWEKGDGTLDGPSECVCTHNATFGSYCVDQEPEFVCDDDELFIDATTAGTWYNQYGYGTSCESYYQAEEEGGYGSPCAKTASEINAEWGDYGTFIAPAGFTQESLFSDFCPTTCCKELAPDSTRRSARD